MKKRASKRQIMDLKCESSMEKLWMLLFFFQPFCTCPSFSVCWVEARTPFLWFFFLLFFKSYVRGQVLIHAGHRYSRLGLSVQLVKVIPEDVSPAHQKASSVQNSPFSHVLLWRGESVCLTVGKGREKKEWVPDRSHFLHLREQGGIDLQGAAT